MHAPETPALGFSGVATVVPDAAVFVTVAVDFLPLDTVDAQIAWRLPI